tara:strand:+ start:61 stop:303 length:243 start_codon:yes stop_codon:yes gene_type:complete
MAKTPSEKVRSTGRAERARCESVHFAEVEFVSPVVPRLVVQFSDGLSVLVEDESAIGLAAEFIAAFRAQEDRVHDEGGRA